MYLAISKILYWIDSIGEVVTQSDLEGAGMLALNRVISRELPIILVVVCIIIIDMSKGKLLVKLVIGYVVSLASISLYIFIMNHLVFQMPLGLEVYIDNAVGFTIYYAIISVILSVKYHLKDKLKESSETEVE